MNADLKFAFRQLAKSPGFTLTAALTLALGIGLSASSFSIANTFLLRDVPYPAPDRLVRVFGTSPQSQFLSFSPGYGLELADIARSFSSVCPYNADLYALGEPGQPAEQVLGLSVSANFLDVLGVQPFLGRGFTPGEDEPAKPAVAVLTYRSWVRRYASDPHVIGRTVRLNMQNYTVIGVLPASFDAPIVWGPIDYVLARTVYPGWRQNWKDSWLQIVGRLKPGVPIRQAQAELSTIAARFSQAHAKELTGVGMRVVALHDSNMDSVSRSLLWLMTGISLAMLLIACANLASLQVARAFGRNREFAIRAALGGTRRQLMAPLLLESLVLAIIGGIGGVFIANWSNRIIGSMLLINGEPGFAISLDGRVLAFTAFTSVLSGLAFGLAPAWLSSRSTAAEALKEGARSTSSPSHQRLKSGLIVCELALAVVLVGVAAAFGFGARSFFHRDVGWNMDGLFTGSVVLPYTPYSDDTRNRTFQRALIDRLQAIPGVEHAVLCAGLPLYAVGGTQRLVVEGQPVEEPTRRPLTEVGLVSTEYFTALGIPVKQGSLFAPGLTEKDPDVAVINETFARRFWPGENPIGRRVRLGDSDRWIQVIGVVADIRMLVRLTSPETRLQMYRPLIQSPARYLTIALRSSVAPEMLTKSVRQAVAIVDADLPVAQPGSLRSSFERNLANLNMVIVNLGISAGMGLLIAAVGLFGVIAQLTAQRTRDIGVRIALGAGYGNIMWMVIGQGARLLLFAAILGAPGYYALTFLLHRAMPEMKLPGVWLLATNLLVIALTTLLACYVPARRAARINPVEALRTE